MSPLGRASRIGSLVVLALVLLGAALAPRVNAGGAVGVVVSGARETAATACVALVVTAAVGLLFGGLSALGPRLIDSALSRSVETAASLPSIVTALAVVRTSTLPPAVAFGIVIGVLRGLALAKTIRSEVRSLRVAEFCVAARALGSSGTRLFLTHLVPHVVPVALGVALASSAAAVSLESALAFLGLGGAVPSWGAELASAIQSGRATRVAVPLLATLATVLSLHEAARAVSARFGVRRHFA